jgi:hypothetical protein
MNKLGCKVCRYYCSNEQSFISHLQSKRHLKLTANAQQNVADNITLNIEPEEVKEEIKEEIKEEKKVNTIDNSILESLIFQNQMMMKLLMGQQNNAIVKENNTIIKKNNTIIKEKKSTAFSVESYLKITCKDAINFEELFTKEYILNEKYNNYIMYKFENEKDEKDNKDDEDDKNKILLLKEIAYNSLPSPYKFGSDFFCSAFNEIDHHKKPLFCSDAKRGIFYLKTDNKWIKVDKHDLIDRIWNRLITFMFKAFGNTKRLKKDRFKQIYGGRDYYNWYNVHADKLLIILGSIDKDLIHTIIPVLCKLCDKKYVAYKNEKAHVWNEEKQETEEQNETSDAETDSDY